MLFGFLLLLWTASAPARACEPLTADALAAQVDQARTAVFDADGASWAAVSGRIAAEVPCLDHPVDPDTWATLLVLHAVIAYRAEGDWITPLDAALRAQPDVDRMVDAAHPIADWRPLSLSAGVDGRMPPGVEAWLNGRSTPFTAVVVGEQLLQVRGGGVLVSALVQGDGSSDPWGDLLAQVSAAPAVVGPAPDEAAALYSARAGAPQPAWPLFATGGALAAGGGAAMLWSSRRSQAGAVTPADWDLLVGVNVVGFAGVVLGAGAAGWGLTRTLSWTASPGGVAVGGAF